MTKTQAAFRFSVGKLFDTGLAVHLWTFTFVSVITDNEAYKRWNKLNLYLSREFGKGECPGIRVMEVHPGKYNTNGIYDSHGLHFHVLLGGRRSVGLVRRLARKAGFGRIDVTPRIKAAADAYYIGKYLGKSEKKVPHRRAWGMVGKFKGCRVKDVRCEGPGPDLARAVAASCPRTSKNQVDFLEFRTRLHEATLAGHTAETYRAEEIRRENAAADFRACQEQVRYDQERARNPFGWCVGTGEGRLGQDGGSLERRAEFLQEEAAGWEIGVGADDEWVFVRETAEKYSDGPF